MAGPLAGVRVLDLTSVLMGPYATQILGDLGAEVIWVEQPHGDVNRAMGAGPDPELPGVALNLLRNKSSICLDLKHPAGRQTCLRIAATCDVVVTNLRPGPLQRLGLGYDDVRAVRPDVVFCRASGYPSDSARAEEPAYDDIVQAASGLCDTYRLRSGTPELAPYMVADKVAGLTIVWSILAALYHRATTGDGQLVEVPMVEAMSAFTLVEHGCAAIPDPPYGRAGYGRALTTERRPRRTLDGWIVIVPYTRANYEAIFRIGGRNELFDDERLSTPHQLNQHAESLYAEVAEIVAERTTAEWLELCAQEQIPASALRTIDSCNASAF